MILLKSAGEHFWHLTEPTSANARMYPVFPLELAKRFSPEKSGTFWGKSGTSLKNPEKIPGMGFNGGWCIASSFQ